MKSRKLQKCKFSNSLVNWEELGSTAYVYIQKNLIFHLFLGLGKTWSLSPTFKNPSIESVNELICPNLMFTIENKTDDLK